MENLQAWMSQALQAHQQGRLDEAVSLYQQVLTLDPRHFQAFSNLGVAQRALGQSGEAEASYRRAIAIKPDFADAFTNLANLLRKSRPVEALAAYEQAVAIKPDDANILYNYAATLLDLGRAPEAAEAYHRAIVLRPEFAEAWSNLGVALADCGQYQTAVESYRHALALKPDLVQAYSNLGLALQEQGLPQEAIAAFDEALALQPGPHQDRTNRIFGELYRPGVTLAEMLRLARQMAASPPPNGPKPDNAAKPRLGFVSADFRVHAVGMLVIAALEGLHGLGFEIVCYSNSPRSDGLTDRFRKIATWREAWALGDNQLEAQIRADEIDILFDLSGYTRGHRLEVFARKPAPVQVAWVGYPATTGVPAMDYLLSDARQTPPGVEGFYSEKLLRLPHSYVCFDPPGDAPEPGPLPALKNGFVTFGSFNALKKINAGVIWLWSRILVGAPGARLLLKAPAFDCVKTTARVVAAFQDAGVEPARLDIRGGSSPHQHMAAMAETDIALDSFPYSGGMTTLDLLWMGLPVVTWPGETMASRHSLGYLATVGLEELAASDPDAYAALAATLAKDTARLAGLRQGMRQRILSSPLGDQAGFCADLAGLLQQIARA